MSEQADVVVIGMGPGAEYLAGRLVESGVNVLAIERELVGGECPYWGCIPSKMAIRASNLLTEARRVAGMAGEATVTPDWATVATRIREEATDDWNDQAAADRFTGKGGRLIRGEGRLTGPGRVSVGDLEVEARKAIVIGTGSRPTIPPVPGLADLNYWTNREALETRDLPSSLILLGGGAIGLELGQMFARFGSRVAVVEALDRLITTEEPEASELIENVLRGEGIDVRVGVTVEKATSVGKGFRLDLANGDEVHGERLLVSAGRRGDVAGVGLDTVGVPADAPWVPVDEHMRVAPGVWAVGDITGKGAFTHMSMYQARIALADILDEPHEPAEYRAVPRVTFTDPEIGSVGMTEAEARSAGLDVRTGMTQVPSTARGWIHKAGNDGFIKLVEDARRGVLVGATSAGPVGGEVLSLLALAVHAELPTGALRSMIYAYPTFHGGIEDALRDLH